MLVHRRVLQTMPSEMAQGKGSKGKVDGVGEASFEIRKLTKKQLDSLNR